MDEAEEIQAVRGLSRTLKRIRRPRGGRLEAVIVVAIVLMLVAGFMSIFYVIQQQARQANRDRQLAAISTDAREAAINARNLLMEIRAALAAEPVAQQKAIAEILAGIEELLARQTQVVVREQARRDTVVIVVSPQPQPTATVTCDPRPVVGNCKRR